MEKLNVIGLLLIFMLILVTENKTYKKNITLKQLTTLSQTIFLTKYDFGNGQGNIVLKYNKYGQYFPDDINIRIGLIVQQNYKQHKSAETCYQKQTYYRQIQTLKYFDTKQGIQFLKINKAQQKHRWFVFIYTCDWIDLFDDGSNDGLNFDIVLNNQGANKYGQFSVVIWPYTILFILWILSLIKLLKPIQNVLNTRKNIAAVFLVIGYILLGIAICLKYFSILSAIITGTQIQLFDAIHKIFKSSIQIIMATMLTSIAWGWLLNNNNFRIHYLITISTVTFLNILSVIIVYSIEDTTSDQHLYQGFAGKIVLFIRILISLIFVSGCLYISYQCQEKNKQFIRHFAQIGFIYLFSGLISLILVQIVVPVYLHGEAIYITEEMIRMIANIALCWLFSYPTIKQQGKIKNKISDLFYGFQEEQDVQKMCTDKSHLKYVGKAFDAI